MTLLLCFLKLIRNSRTFNLSLDRAWASFCTSWSSGAFLSTAVTWQVWGKGFSQANSGSPFSCLQVIFNAPFYSRLWIILCRCCVMLSKCVMRASHWKYARLSYFIISECEDLIRCMLNVDPSKRATMRDIINHRWMKMSGEDEKFDRLVDLNLRHVEDGDQEELNEVVLQHMRGLKIDVEQTVKVCLLFSNFKRTLLSC